MPLPETCLLWKDPERAIDVPMKEQFELIETLFHSSHHWRYLLRCRGCGADYLFEFYEEIDWEHGQDPQCSTYVPIQSEAQLAELRTKTDHLDLFGFTPRLVNDRPKGAKEATTAWIGRAGMGDPH